MMKIRWKQRGLALMAVLALAVPAAGVTADPTDAVELFEPQIAVEDVEQAAELADAELPVEPDDPDMYDPLVFPEYADLELAAAQVAQDDAHADEDGPSEGEDTPDAGDASASEPAPDAPVTSDDTEAAEAPATAEVTGTSGESDAPETVGASDAVGTPEDAEPAEGDAAEKGDEEADSTSKPESTADPEAPETPPPAEAAAVVAEAEETAPKLAAEAAPALSFPAASLYMGKGERTTLAAQLTGAEGVTVSYASNKPKIVSVDASGKLTARKKGVATITATASNGLTASCTVKVVKAPSRVKLGKKKLTFGLGETRALSAKLPKGTASAITWTSANPAVVSVDAAGNLTGVGAGKARVTARTFNGKKATCTVTILNGKTPTTLTFPSATINMGKKEKRKLVPQLGAGEAANFTYTSSKKSVVSVNRNGMMTAKKKGTARITVKTHNGLKYRLTVKVIKAPTKLTLAKKNFSMHAGEAQTIKYTLPAGTASALTWTSSDPNIAAVGDGDTVVAISPGKVTLTAKTYNGKSASCTLTVTPPLTAEEIAKNTPPGLTNAEMAANLRASTALGSKRQALGDVAQLLMDNGFSPAFAAGVVANIYSEGSYGKLESSDYGIKSGNETLQKKRPKYFCYLDGGIYYVNSVPSIEFVAPEAVATYSGPAPLALKRYGDENYYLNNWSSKYVYNCDLNALQAFIDNLTNNVRQDGVTYSHDWGDGKMWHGKFGMGCTQWTGGRTRKLMALYRKYAGAGSATITKAQVTAAEHEMILYDLTGDYKSVYTKWLNDNENAKYCAEAAYSAGSLVCLKYEIPANKETSAVKRGNNASKFYKIMVGEN